MASLSPASEGIVVAQPKDILVYTLTNDNPCNTSLVDLSSESPRPAYTVQTEVSGSNTITTVKNSEETLIASLKWREWLPDKVTIGDKPAVSLNKWLKSGLLPRGPVSFHDDQGRKYQWKNVAAGLNMELYAMDTPGGPIAAFSRARADRVGNTSTPSTFKMTPRAREIADIVVASFLFLERRRRMQESSVDSRQESSKTLVFVQ